MANEVLLTETAIRPGNGELWRIIPKKRQNIPFNRPCLMGRELECVSEAVAGGHISGDGSFSKRCQKLFEESLGVSRALLTPSCTDALEMAALLLDIRPGDEVIVPSFTFVSTVNAFVLRGAQPVFSDIRPDTLNMDENQLEKLISHRTRAIVPVHYAGVGCEMDAIMEISRNYQIPIVEDNAHGLFGAYKGKNLGTFGCLSTLSFHETKNFTCGEGGALLINDPVFINRAEILREKGTNRSRFFRGEVDKYTWVDLGSSFLPSDIQGAFLFAQLEARDMIYRKRRHIWQFYFTHLQSWAAQNDVQLPIVPDTCEQPYHMFYMILPSLEQRQDLIHFLKSRNISSVFHYLPLHLSYMGRKFGGKKGDCPRTEAVSDGLLRLPFFNHLSENDLDHIVESILAYKV